MAYFRFHDHVKVYNSLAGGLGKPHYKVCSIPQGFPFSMMLISLILRPIIFYLRLFCPSVTVRILADDISLTQDGDDASEFGDAFNRLHYFLHKLGAKLAPDKSYFSYRL